MWLLKLEVKIGPQLWKVNYLFRVNEIKVLASCYTWGRVNFFYIPNFFAFGLGQIEYFKDTYGGVPRWIDDQTYYTFFTEGWGLYSENPVIAEDTNTYKEEPMQRFGMLKWQVMTSFLNLFELEDTSSKTSYLWPASWRARQTFAYILCRFRLNQTKI